MSEDAPHLSRCSQQESSISIVLLSSSISRLIPDTCSNNADNRERISWIDNDVYMNGSSERLLEGL